MSSQSKKKSVSNLNTTAKKTKKGSLKHNVIVDAIMKGKKLSSSDFEKDITVKFMEILLMVKLYHWKTYSYAQHKATDDFYGSLNEHMDTFIEILMGKTGMRIDLMKHKTIKLVDLTNMKQFKSKLTDFKDYLVGLDNHTFIKSMLNTDLLNIRDEILGDVNKLLYLLTLE